MLIVVDTSALLFDYHLQSPAWQMLRLAAPYFGPRESTELSLAIPAVVIDELVQKAREAISQGDQFLRKGVKELKRFGCGPALEKSVGVDVDEVVDKYRRQLMNTLRDRNVTILDYPQTPHADVIKRMNSGLKPFKGGEGKERGYRDYLIWLSVLHKVAESVDDQVVFVTGNTKDFCDSSGAIHPDLASMLSRPDSVIRRSNLAEVTDQYVRPLLQNADAFLTTLTGNWELMFIDNIRGRINELVSADLPHEIKYPSDLTLTSLGAENAYGIGARSALLLPDGRFLVSVEAEASANVALRGPAGKLIALAERGLTNVSFTFDTQDSHYATLSFDGGPLHLQVEVIVNENFEIESFDLKRMSGDISSW